MNDVLVTINHPERVDGLPLSQRQIQDEPLILGISALCKEDKEQLNRIEDMLDLLIRES